MFMQRPAPFACIALILVVLKPSLPHALQGLHSSDDPQLLDATGDQYSRTVPEEATAAGSQDELLQTDWPSFHWPFHWGGHPDHDPNTHEVELFPKHIKVEPLPDSFVNYRECYSKFIPIFGFPVIATEDVPDWMVEHAGNVFAQYLDSDNDGVPDNSKIVAQMRKRRTLVVMFVDKRPKACHISDAVHNYELNCADDGIPPFVARYWRVSPDALLHGHPGTSLINAKLGLGSPEYSAALEEILHLIMDQGYAIEYPDVFARSEKSNSLIVQAMKEAIGDCGYAYDGSNHYPGCQGWYHYDDKTCDFDCLASEYIHWSLTSALGGQDGSHKNIPAADENGKRVDRCKDIEQEWELCSAELLSEHNPKVLKIYGINGSNPYNVPSVLPDGHYDPKQWPQTIDMQLNKNYFRIEVPSAVTEVASAVRSSSRASLRFSGGNTEAACSSAPA